MASTHENPVTLAVPPPAKWIADTRDDQGRLYLLLGLSEEMNARIEELALRTGDTKADLLNKAVGLYKLVSDAFREGKRVVIVDDQQGQETEIVGL